MSNENDPLVEAVARAIRPTLWDSNEAACAAIKAVLEWYSKAENVPNDVAGRVYDMTDMTSLNDSAIVFSSAIQTELKRREG